MTNPAYKFLSRMSLSFMVVLSTIMVLITLRTMPALGGIGGYYGKVFTVFSCLTCIAGIVMAIYIIAKDQAGKNNNANLVGIAFVLAIITPTFSDGITLSQMGVSMTMFGMERLFDLAMLQGNLGS